MKWPFLILLCFIFNTAQAGWQSYLDRNVFKGRLENFFPEARYIQLPWRQSSEISFERRPLQPESLHPIHLPSKEKLWPTHPQQTTKEYLYAVWAPYDYTRLPPRSSVCLTPNPTRRFCQHSTWVNVVVISDTFEDQRGRLYRGYWPVYFLHTDENMGTLLSKGRTVYPKPGSTFDNDFVEGQTYEVKAGDFLFLAELLPADLRNIQREQTRAKSRWIKKGKLFIPR